jgi:hypothetical protein
MSNLSQFAPFVAGGLKSLQTGYVSITTTSVPLSAAEDTGGLANITISSVNTAKAIPGGVLGCGSYPLATGAYNLTFSDSFNSAQYAQVSLRLTSATNLQLNTAPMNTIRGRWYVAEAN